MRDEKQTAKPKNYVASVCGLEEDQFNVKRFVQALTNYCTLHQQMVAKSSGKPAPRPNKIMQYKTGNEGAE